MAVGHASPTAVNQASDLHLAVRAAPEEDVRKTKVAVSKDEVFLRRNRGEKLSEEVGRQASCANLIEVILAHATGGHPVASGINLPGDTLVERAIDGTGLMN